MEREAKPKISRVLSLYVQPLKVLFQAKTRAESFLFLTHQARAVSFRVKGSPTIFNFMALYDPEFWLQPVRRISTIWPYLLLSGLAVVVIRAMVSRFNVDRKISALGGFGTARGYTWAPFGLDFLYRGLSAAVIHQVPQFWAQVLSDAKRPAHLQSPTTVDCRVAGERFLFTIDPENVKALLAAQFNDYGKGEIFHDDWKDFM